MTPSKEHVTEKISNGKLIVVYRFSIKFSYLHHFNVFKSIIIGIVLEHPYPNEKTFVAFHLDMSEATRPKTKAEQSNNM